MSSSWSIAVKTVGGGSSTSSEALKKSFTVSVSPDDSLSALHDRIENETGLKASQQRLIYRGRLISGGDGETPTGSAEEATPKNAPKVKDVIGLCDGQTIHLVPRSGGTTTTTGENSSTPSAGTSRTMAEGGRAGLFDPTGAPPPVVPANAPPATPAQTNGAGAFVAALLGLSGDEPTRTPTGTTATQQLNRLRSSRIRRNRRNAYRLTHADLETPDPGSMEPVRQSLMTMHTLLGANTPVGDEKEGHDARACMRREWYRGQWLDCRDTVNQWLEATIVEIKSPNEILPSYLQASVATSDRAESWTASSEVIEPTSDPAVSANDNDGRMKLLLEPSDNACSDEEWGGYQQRKNNEHVQLLLVHYNGWPERWDEWIRSDSERIRPFRTRTRHPTAVRFAV